MPLSVVTVASNGLPINWVSASPLALPITEAASGIAVTKVTSGGLPATYVTAAGAIVSPFTPTTWNSSDKSANASLSADKLTLTAIGSSGSARSIFSASSGKYYWEMTLNTWSNGVDNVAGMALATAAFTGGAGTIVLRESGGIFLNNTVVITPWSGLVNGQVADVAADITNRRIWFRVRAKATTWNGNASYDPATGVGGVDFSALAGPMFAWCFGQANTASFTANFGASAFGGAVPSGYTPGWG